MRAADVRSLIDYSAWANRQVLGAAARAGPDTFLAPSDVTDRNLRGTLVHTLDVERSWRDRLRGLPQERWETDLPVDEFRTVEELLARWEREEAELRDWLSTLTDEDVAAVVDLGGKDRFPLWYFLVHIVTHSAQQRRDAVVLLTGAGHEVPEIEFLYYADVLASGDGGASDPGAGFG